MPNINYTKIGNTITISSDYVKALGAVARLGPAQIQFTTPNVTMNEDIFFKFYTCDDSTGIKVYSELNIEAANALDMERMLTMVFLNYYADSTIVNELSTLGDSFAPLAERLNGVVTPTVELSAEITMPASSSNFVEFVGMGLGSRVGAAYINGGITGRSQVWGTRVAQVHMTSTNPLGPTPIEALYDNTDLGCWTFSTYNTTGIIVYTNLTSGAFTPAKGLGHWGQVLCVWPIIARVKNAQYACMFNNFDQSFMRSGLGYFDRAARKNTYFGWAGNYIQSIFNDWEIPVISPIWSMSDLALATYMTYGSLGGSAPGNYGSIALQQKQFRFVGPVAYNNITSITEKTIRSSLPLLWANESRYGSVNAISSAIPDFNFVVTDPEQLNYDSVADYIIDCLNGVPEGYNAHLYRYMLQGQAQNLTPTVTRSYITSGVTWSANLASQPTLLGVFTDSANGYPKYYEPAVSSFFSIVAGQYGAALKSRIQDGVLIVVRAMNATEMQRVTNWLYTSPSP